MKKTVLSSLLALLFSAGVAEAQAHTITFTWTWPTMRQDGTALPLSQIANAVIYDTSKPQPGQPGTVVPCDTTLTFPPTTATATCTTGTISGSTDNYIVEVSDNSMPPQTSGPSNVVSVPVPLSAPVAVANLSFHVN
jgi:hypothetical protein